MRAQTLAWLHSSTLLHVRDPSEQETTLHTEMMPQTFLHSLNQITWKKMQWKLWCSAAQIWLSFPSQHVWPNFSQLMRRDPTIPTPGVYQNKIVFLELLLTLLPSPTHFLSRCLPVHMAGMQLIKLIQLAQLCSFSAHSWRMPPLRIRHLCCQTTANFTVTSV